MNEDIEKELMELEMPEEENLDINNQAELEELRAKMKIYEEKINVLQTENFELKTMMNHMDKEIRLLKEERNIMHQTALALNPTDNILSNEEYLKLCTGFSSIHQFHWLVKLFESYGNSSFMSTETELLIVLMKLKLNLLSSDLAFRFQVSRTTVKRIFDKWFPLLAGKLQSLIRWPSRRCLKKFCPQSFKYSEYKDTVCIIDCIAVPIEKPNNQRAQSETWSNYKNSQTVKFLVAIAPSGCISFVSKAWGGRNSDKKITLKSGFLEKISHGDLVLADRDFNVEEYFTAKGAKLVVPSFTKGKKQLSKQEVIHSKKVLNVCNHIKRIIKLIKQFRILQHKIPIIFLKHIDCIIIICAALSNLITSIIP